MTLSFFEDFGLHGEPFILREAVKSLDTWMFKESSEVFGDLCIIWVLVVAADLISQASKLIS